MTENSQIRLLIFCMYYVAYVLSFCFFWIPIPFFTHGTNHRILLMKVVISKTCKSKGNNISNLLVLKVNTNAMSALRPHHVICQDDRQGIWHRSTGVQMLFLRFDLPRASA